MAKKIIIGGGGTGGHVFPAISVADAVRAVDPDMEILFVGALGRLEMEKVPEAGYKIYGLPVSGFRRSLSLSNLGFFGKLWKSMRMAAKIIKEFKPDIVLGVGGYASGPILMAAAKKGIPVIIQEQNSYAGLTNRLLASKAQKICVAYDGMEKYFPAEKILLTGNPVRQDILSCREKKREGLIHFGMNEKDPVVLILGGSLGARTINETICKGLSNLPGNIQLLWQTGQLYYQDALKCTENAGTSKVKVMSFISEMNLAYGCADIIVSRAGAGTISELAIAGKPAILIPSPNVAEDHQTKNARSLTGKNAAMLVYDNEAGEKLIHVIINCIENEELRNVLSENIMKLAIPDAGEKIAGEIFKLIKN